MPTTASATGWTRPGLLVGRLDQAKQESTRDRPQRGWGIVAGAGVFGAWTAWELRDEVGSEPGSRVGTGMLEHFIAPSQHPGATGGPL